MPWPIRAAVPPFPNPWRWASSKHSLYVSCLLGAVSNYWKVSNYKITSDCQNKCLLQDISTRHAPSSCHTSQPKPTFLGLPWLRLAGLLTSPSVCRDHALLRLKILKPLPRGHQAAFSVKWPHPLWHTHASRSSPPPKPDGTNAGHRGTSENISLCWAKIYLLCTISTSQDMEMSDTDATVTKNLCYCVTRHPGQLVKKVNKDSFLVVCSCFPCFFFLFLSI